jgi:hypothetical protein
MPTIQNVTPAANAAVGDSINVTAKITSPYVITSATVTLGGATAPLVGGGANTFTGTLNASSQPLGPATLSVIATDANGETATFDVPVKHDHAPALAVTTPDLLVARPTVALKATCTDTDVYPCASLAVEACSGSGACTALATTATASLDQTVSLSAYEGRAINLRFTATDTAGATTVLTRKVYVESDPHLALVDELGPGPVLDIDSTRILFVGASGVSIKDRVSGTVTVLAGGAPSYGRLSSAGAVWVGGDWINGTYTPRANTGLIARGDWAAWSVYGVTTITRENLATGLTSVIPGSAGTAIASFDIDSGGNVAYSDYSSGFRIHVVSPAGTDQVLSALSNGVLPVIDGTNIVWQRHASGVRVALLLQTAAGAETLDPYSGAPLVTAQPDVGYRANDGWIAYTKVLAGGGLTAWTRSPAGVQALATPLANVQAIAGLSPDGEIAYDVGPNSDRTNRYISAAGPANPTSPLPIGGSNGTMVHTGGVWYELIGRSAFRVDPTGGADAGADGGASDAGSDSGEDDAGNIGGRDAGDDSGAKASGEASADDGASSGVASDDVGGGASGGAGDDGGCAAAPGPAAGGLGALGLGLGVALATAARHRASRRRAKR